MSSGRRLSIGVDRPLLLCRRGHGGVVGNDVGLVDDPLDDGLLFGGKIRRQRIVDLRLRLLDVCSC
jgi:hypothetical protein